MFWSHDLLGKKTALGAVWIAAHGKKLNKGSILKVNVADACSKVMDPEVPQALRLQAILMGGIVIVHARQEGFLLEDAQEMLRRLRALGSSDGAGPDAAKVTLGGEKRAAREEAITLPLNGDMALLGLGDLFPVFPGGGPALSQGPATSGRSERALSQGLFVMPSMPDGGEVQSGPSGASSKGRRRGARGAAAEAAAGGSGGGLLGAPEGGEVALSLEGLPRHDLELMADPETFAVPDLELFELGGLGGGLGGGALPDDLMPVPSGMFGEPPAGQPEVEGPQHPPGSQTPQTSGERSGSEGGGGAAPRTKPKRRGGKRRGRPTLDDIDTLQIRGREYREWMNDRSDLLVPRPQRSLGAPLAHEAGGGGGAHGLGPLAAGPATAASLLGGAWPPELAELFARKCTLPKAAARPKKGKKAAGGQEGGEEEEGEAARGHGGRWGREALLDELAADGPHALLGAEEPGFGAYADAYGGYGGPDGLDAYAAGFGEGLGGAYGAPPGEGEGPEGSGGHFRDRTAAALRAAAAAEGRALSGSEGEFDVETERLRAALNSTQGFGTEPYFLPGGATPASLASGGRGGGAAGGVATRGRRASSLLRRDSESGAASEKSSERRGASRLSDLLQGPGADLAGGGDLGAMLPAVGEDEPFLEEEEDGEGASGSRKRRRTGELGTGTGPSGEGLTQYELMEQSGPSQAPGAGGGAGGLPGGSPNNQTLNFINVMRARFHAAESQLGDEAQGGEGGAAPAQLSLFQMAGRLSRMEAAKLFYQVLVTRTQNFLSVQQEEPYGDLVLTRGPFL